MTSVSSSLANPRSSCPRRSEASSTMVSGPAARVMRAMAVSTGDPVSSPDRMTVAIRCAMPARSRSSVTFSMASRNRSNERAMSTVTTDGTTSSYFGLSMAECHSAATPVAANARTGFRMTCSRILATRHGLHRCSMESVNVIPHSWVPKKMLSTHLQQGWVDPIGYVLHSSHSYVHPHPVIATRAPANKTRTAKRPMAIQNDFTTAPLDRRRRTPRRRNSTNRTRLACSCRIFRYLSQC